MQNKYIIDKFDLQLKGQFMLKLPYYIKGGLKKNLTKLRLWLNKGGGSAAGESFYMKKILQIKSLFCRGGGGPGNFFGLNICKLKN